MIDLNFLYTFATNNNEEKEVREDYYLKAQALVNESKQNFALYYEGVLSERIYKCVDDAHSELTSIDLFILLLDEFGYEVTDFLDAIKNYNFEQKNVVDKYFYDFAPNLRIFSAFNEIRIRNNWALFSDAKTGEKLPQNVISNENFLFKHPIKFLGDGWLKDVFCSMLKEDAEDAFMTDAKVATLLAPFYLKNSLYFDIDSLPTFIKNNIHIVKDYCDEFRSKENLESAIKGEHEEWAVLYAEAEKIAREEGFEDVAETFHHVINSEQHHYNRYKKLLDNIKNDTVFKKTSEVVWMCRECGYLYKGKSAPQKCPNCHHPQAYFQIFSENY